MNKRLLEMLSPVTEEEKKILSGAPIDKSLYTDEKGFTVQASKMLTGEKLIDIRLHTRFVNFPKHRHNYFEMIYMCNGETTHRINGSEPVVLKEGGLLLLGMNAVHEVAKAGREDIAVNFIIKPEFFNSTLEIVGYGNAIYRSILSELSRGGAGGFLLFNVQGVLPVQNLAENLIWSFLYEKNSSCFRQNVTMGLLFSELTDASETFVKSDLYGDIESEISLKTARYIENSYAEAKLSDLALKCNLSAVALSKLIKKSTGETFKDLLQKKRLREAEKLIRNSDIPVTEIIYSVGYENTNFFYRLFRENYGCSPKEYRRKNGCKNRYDPLLQSDK